MKRFSLLAVLGCVCAKKKDKDEEYSRLSLPDWREINTGSEQKDNIPKRSDDWLTCTDDADCDGDLVCVKYMLEDHIGGSAISGIGCLDPAICKNNGAWFNRSK